MSGGGGLVQLMATGAQNAYINDADLKFSPFRQVYRKCTNYAVESVRQTTDGQARYGGRLTCVLSRSGDLVTNVMLEIVLKPAPVQLAGVQAVLLTSANGARALAQSTWRRDLLVLTVGGATATALNVVLTIVTMRDSATVTASRDSVEAAGRTGQPVNVIQAAEIADRAKVVVAQAVEFEPGVQLQRTSPSMAGVFIRGLVGNKVNMYVDGVRYSNGAQRGGVNTFLDLVDAGGLDSIEVLRGPSSDQYGSDALGGSIHFFSKTPALSGGGTRFGGSAGVSGGTGHKNGGGSLFGSIAGENFGVTGSLSGRKVGLARSGGGIDSHAAVTRFFGVASNTIMGERLPDTGFEQYGGQVRLTYVPNVNTQFTTSYQRSFQDGAKRYDQVTYNSQTYNIDNVTRRTIAGTDMCDYCTLFKVN